MTTVPQPETINAEKLPAKRGQSRMLMIAGGLALFLAIVYSSRFYSSGKLGVSDIRRESGDAFMIDEFEEGIFRQIEFGDYPQILVEDAEGRINAYGCSDGCPPVDQDPAAYLNRNIRVYLRNQTTPGIDSPEETSVKVVVRIELLP
jgi:hypothetical protein